MATNAAGQPQIVSTLAQLAGGKSQIDWSVNCGNMSAALPYWAIDQHFLPRQLNGQGEVEIFNTNTKTTMIGRVTLAGDGFAVAQIPGVDGEFPGVDLFMANPVGAKTGKALPTGSAADSFGKYTVSCVDVAVPMVIARASEFGKTGTEPVKDLRNDEVFFSALKKLWIEAGLKMGLKGKGGQPMTAEELANSETIPKVCIVGPPVNGGNISTRYFTPQEGHATMAVTGGCCLAAACLMPGTVAHELARGLPGLTGAHVGGAGRYRKSGRHSVGHHRRPADQFGNQDQPRRLQALGASPAARLCADLSRLGRVEAGAPRHRRKRRRLGHAGLTKTKTPARGRRFLFWSPRLYANLPWQCLNFLPEPQGHGSLRPTLPQLAGLFGLRSACAPPLPCRASDRRQSAGASLVLAGRRIDLVRLHVGKLLRRRLLRLLLHDLDAHQLRGDRLAQALTSSPRTG